MLALSTFLDTGDTDSDSHKTLPTISHDRSRLDSIELYPFKKLIDNGIGSIMSAHLYVPNLDSNKYASSLSKKINHDLLKEELGFKGLTITDALNMKGVTKYFKSGELEVRALLADNDILLFSENVPKAIRAIEKRRGGRHHYRRNDRRKSTINFKSKVMGRT